MREGFGNFKEEVYQMLSEIGVELKNLEARMDEVENRVAEAEELNANAKDFLLQTPHEQRHILSKLTDSEACPCRNNLCIFRIPEG